MPRFRGARAAWAGPAVAAAVLTAPGAAGAAAASGGRSDALHPWQVSSIGWVRGDGRGRVPAVLATGDRFGKGPG